MEQAKPIRIMQVIARMNVGGPAVIVTELMKGLNPANFQAVLVTGYCAENEAEYLEENKQNFSVSRITGLGRSVSFFQDFKSFISLAEGRLRSFGLIDFFAVLVLIYTLPCSKSETLSAPLDTFLDNASNNPGINVVLKYGRSSDKGFARRTRLCL